MFRKMTTAAFIVAASVGAVNSQTQPQAQPVATPDVNIQTLLNSGFTIVAMQYLNQSMVFTLQRHTVAYVCDTTLNGETKICIRLK